MRPRPVAYGASIAAVALATLGTFAVYPWIEPSISLLFFPAVLIIAIYGGYGPALLATALSTAMLAFFFVPPRYSLDIGIDDAVRIAVFVVVAVVTAWLSAARTRAEDAKRKSLGDLQAAIETLRKVSGWPVLSAADTAASLRRILQHAASVVGARGAAAAWEAEEEPWTFLASSTPADGPLGGITRHSPGEPIDDLVSRRLGPDPLVSAGFRTTHLSGSVIFSGAGVSAGDNRPVIEVVAREVGNSLDQLYLADRLREFAVREDRIRLARDLHDGVLQSLTGVRLQLQAIAKEADEQGPLQERLLAIERALAIEQRELRLFIDDLKPVAAARTGSTSLAQHLDDMSARLAAEWKVPIVARVTPSDLALPAGVVQELRLMVHEAIVNALKHAHPSKVSADVTAADGTLRIVVHDDGLGFPVRGRLDHETLVRTDTGPASLRDRVAALGGRMSLESTTSGSRIEITLPSDQTSLLRT